MKEICEAFSISRTFLKDHYNRKFKRRKIEPPKILIKDEKAKLLEYMVEMVRLIHPLSINDLKLKVVEILPIKEN